jgi:5'-3' exonuclease
VTFDMAGGTFRDQVYDKYKATRVKADQELYDQIPMVHEIVEGRDKYGRVIAVANQLEARLSLPYGK